MFPCLSVTAVVWHWLLVASDSLLDIKLPKIHQPDKTKFTVKILGQRVAQATRCTSMACALQIYFNALQ